MKLNEASWTWVVKCVFPYCLLLSVNQEADSSFATLVKDDGNCGDVAGQDQYVLSHTSTAFETCNLKALLRGTT